MQLTFLLKNHCGLLKLGLPNTLQEVLVVWVVSFFLKHINIRFIQALYTMKNTVHYSYRACVYHPINALCDTTHLTYRNSYVSALRCHPQRVITAKVCKPICPYTLISFL